MPSIFTKDPDAVLDYKFDWDSWLEAGETITTRTITAASGITVDSSSITDSGKSVTVWLSAGTVGLDYSVACKVTTSSSRTDERTIHIQVRQR